jgi:hypothetical protein
MRKLTKPVLATGAAALLLAGVSPAALGQTPPAHGPGSVHAQLQAELHPNTERQRQAAQQQAERTLDREAVAVIADTQAALRAINRNDKPGAIAALERATGKANILLARNPSTALIPTDVEVQVIDTAPADPKAISAPNLAVIAAMARRDYPRARVLLDSLRSEIRVRTYNLPLATYPAALRDAARLLEQGKNQAASDVLMGALNTVVVVDRVMAIPLLNAQDAVAAANAERGRDRNAAIRHLNVARSELKRAELLGYGDRATLAGLDKQIDQLQAQLRRNENSASAFDRLRQAVDNFFKKEAALLHRGDK